VIASLVGGVLIGVAATMLLLLNGRIAGVTGILGNIPTTMPGDRAWRFAFVLGLLVAGLLAKAVFPAAFDAAPSRSMVVMAVAGVLVGFGTRLGNGCTSGHGVCGIARLSKRSVVATTIFMTVAALTVFVTRVVFGGYL
jgi:hypothetical protein